MKFRDNKGKTHNNFISAICKTGVNKMDNFVRNKMPGYEETLNEDEHLYDALPKKFDSYPSENGSIVVEGEVLIPAQSEVPATINTAVESSDSPERYQEVLDVYQNGDMGVKIETSNIYGSIGNNPILPAEVTDVTEKYLNKFQNSTEKESSPDVKDLLKMDHEEPIPSLQKIDIDYAHGVINLKDENGEIIATSSIDQNLTKRSIDKALLDILYPDNSIPTDVSMDIQSKGYIPGHASNSNIESTIEVPVDEQPTPEVGSCG